MTKGMDSNSVSDYSVMPFHSFLSNPTTRIKVSPLMLRFLGYISSLGLGDCILSILTVGKIMVNKLFDCMSHLLYVILSVHRRELSPGSPKRGLVKEPFSFLQSSKVLEEEGKREILEGSRDMWTEPTFLQGIFSCPEQL